MPSSCSISRPALSAHACAIPPPEAASDRLQDARMSRSRAWNSRKTVRSRTIARCHLLTTGGAGVDIVSYRRHGRASAGLPRAGPGPPDLRVPGAVCRLLACPPWLDLPSVRVAYALHKDRAAVGPPARSCTSTSTEGDGICPAQPDASCRWRLWPPCSRAVRPQGPSTDARRSRQAGRCGRIHLYRVVGA